MKKILILVALVLGLVASPAMAKEGPYLGAGLTYVNITSSEPGFETIDPAVGLELRVGYSFGSIALEGNLISSSHNDTVPGYSDADFAGLSIDLRVSLSQENDPTQVYFLAGLGSYAFEETDEFLGIDYELTGGGVNLGVGFEHFFNEQVALDVRGVYRFINYDVEENGVETATGVDGDTFTVGAALNLHF
jgi:hypothetical protein